MPHSPRRAPRRSQSSEQRASASSDPFTVQRRSDPTPGFRCISHPCKRLCPLDGPARRASSPPSGSARLPTLRGWRCGQDLRTVLAGESRHDSPEHPRAAMGPWRTGSPVGSTIRCPVGADTRRARCATGARRRRWFPWPWRGRCWCLTTTRRRPDISAPECSPNGLLLADLLERHADLALVHHLVEAGVLLHPGRLLSPSVSTRRNAAGVAYPSPALMSSPSPCY